MTANERAAQIWAVLALAAHNRQVLTYEMVARLTGVARVGLGRCLEPIQSYCLVKGLSPLTILVVSEKTGMPGLGFIAAQDIPRAQQEVFDYDWLAHGGPSPESFEAAVRERPSNGVIQVPITDPDLRQAASGVDELPRIRVGSPRLAEPERAADFTMEVAEELPHAGLR
jgi:hypothetical protein